MPIKDILVHADSTETFESRLSYAIALAEQHGAHLTALYVIPEYPIPAYVGVPMGPVIIEESLKFETQEIEATRKKLASITDKTGFNVEWRQAQGDPTRILDIQGRYFDLVILGQTDPRWSSEYATGQTDQLVVSLGRPALIIPFIGAEAKPPKHILVAWDGSSAAARALNDALPLLQNADLVEVMTVNPGKDSVNEGDVPAHDICLHLARHDVTVEARVSHATDISTADLFLSHACDMGADLMVMGAYGHSRVREFIFGGVTKHMLKHMTIPVLMSH